MTALPSSALLFEPNTQWKNELGSRIHDFTRSMLVDAKVEMESKSERDSVEEKNGHSAAEYAAAVDSIRKYAVEAFLEELERERQECRRKINEALLPRWDEAFRQRQQAIMEMIEKGEEEDAESDLGSDTTESGVPSPISSSDDEDDFLESLPGSLPSKPPVRVPSTLYPQYDFDIEPNGQWKATLRSSVEGSLRPLVDSAKDLLESKSNSPWISKSERESAGKEYEETLAHIRDLAAETFEAQLEHERQERRWLKVKDHLLNSSKEIQGFPGDNAELFLLQNCEPASTAPHLSATNESQARQEKPKHPMSLDDFWGLAKNHFQQWKTLEEMERIKWKDFPWPSLKTLSTPDELTYTTIEIYLFYPFCFKQYVIDLLRDHIWFLVAMWHPDRFDKIISKVAEEDRATVTQMYRAVLGTFYDVSMLSNTPLLKETWWPNQYAQIIMEATIKRENGTSQPNDRIRTGMNGRGPGTRSWGENVEAEKVSGSQTSETDSNDFAPWQNREKKRRFEDFDENALGKQKWKRIQREEFGTTGDVGTSESFPNHGTTESSGESGSNHSRRLMDIATIVPIVERLEQTFENVSEYKQLLLCRGPQAQMILDLLQTLMSTPNLKSAFRRQLVVTMQRLSKKTQLYPNCFDLKDAVQHICEDPIAAGSFADIHKGRFQNQLVCIKLIRVYQSSQVEYIVKQFSREAILWGQLSHRNLLPFYGIYRYRNRLCLVSPWIEHGHIREYLERNPDVNRLHLALDVAAGISYLHARDIIHGDLKGANILVNSAGIACLADFGLSAITDPQILAWTSQSSPASKGGSLRWQAPELLENDEDVKNTKASDVYAWSCVCYEIFTGRAPFFQLSNPTATLRIIQGVKPSCPPPSTPPRVKWGLTKPIWLLMSDCWAYDPAARPPITVVMNWLAKQSTVPDLRPTGRSGSISAARFRNAMNKPYQYPSLEELDSILSV